jgi:hypothetical protein
MLSGEQPQSTQTGSWPPATNFPLSGRSNKILVGTHRPGKTSAILYNANYAIKAGPPSAPACTHNTGHYVEWRGLAQAVTWRGEFHHAAGYAAHDRL